MRHGLLAALLLLPLRAAAHPGSGIIALSPTTVLTGDAVSNGIWRFELGKPPSRRAASFHCHWVTKGRDGRMYAESLGERGGAWETSVYRLNARAAPDQPVASTVEPVHGVFLVDQKGEIVHQAGDGIVSDAAGGRTKPFRGAGKVASGTRPLAGIKGMAWGPSGALFVSDGDRILRAESDGMLKEVARIEGKVVDPLYAGPDEKAIAWGLAVGDDGVIYAATPALGEVIKITPDGKQEVVARTEHGWAATGVGVSGSTVFLLECKTTEQNNYGPRVRRVSANGKAELVGVVNAEP